MMTRYYQFAGIKIAISMSEELWFQDEFRLTPFCTDGPTADRIFLFEKMEELAPPEGSLVCSDPMRLTYATEDGSVRYIDAHGMDWRKASIRVQYRKNDILVQVNGNHVANRITARYVLECLSAEHLLARNNGFAFHCSYIDHNGKAILFTAPSETGKSTQADLWNKYRGAEIINGDRAAVRLVDDVLMAEGIPFAGSSKYCENRSLPIEAIVYLGQAPRTSIRKLRGYEAFSKIWEGVSVNTWDKEDMERVSAVVQQVASRIPVYHMPCTPDESAVIALEEALRKQVTP